MMVQVRPMSEFFGLEHGEAQVEEHHDGDTEKDALGPGHTRSSAQIRPSITTTKAMMPSTERKSAMDRVSPRTPERDLNIVPNV
jgi:hypothetical protein